MVVHVVYSRPANSIRTPPAFRERNGMEGIPVAFEQQQHAAGKQAPGRVVGETRGLPLRTPYMYTPTALHQSHGRYVSRDMMCWSMSPAGFPMGCDAVDAKNDNLVSQWSRSRVLYI